MLYIQNTDQLLSHGNINLRKTALDIIEYALSKADPYVATKAQVSIEGDLLRVGERKFTLTKNQHIYLVGAGKATYSIAKALEDILGDRISGGVIVCKYGQEGRLAYAALYLAGHPIPDESGC